MIDILFWAFLGIASGVVFGIVPGASVFLATASLYPLLSMTDPVNIMMYYVSVLIAVNYSNIVTSILYGIPGDPTTIVTAKLGFKYYKKGVGNIAVSTSVISSTIGVVFAVCMFLLLFPVIVNIFSFYNSIIQMLVIGIAILLLIIVSTQHKIITFLFFGIGFIISQIGVDPITFEAFATFNNPYLSLGIPFGSVLIGLYLVPEILKISKLTLTAPKPIKKFAVGKNFKFSAVLGSFIGFWCGLIPGVTNILGSQLSAVITEFFFKKSNLKILASAESANNSGALSSLIPLLILAIPITGSEVIIYYLMQEKSFHFNIENTISNFLPILYVLPLVITLSVYLSWHRFNWLGRIAYSYKNHRKKINAGILLLISIMNILLFPVSIWMIICIISLSIIGYSINRFDTSAIIYGYFLGDLFYSSLVRSFIIIF